MELIAGARWDQALGGFKRWLNKCVKKESPQHKNTSSSVSGSRMPRGLGCVTAFLQHFFYTTASLGLTCFKSFKSPNTRSVTIGFPFFTLSGEGFLWSRRASYAKGNHLLPPPSSLCNTRCSVSSVPQTTVMAQKGRLCCWALMLWIWKIFRSILASNLLSWFRGPYAQRGLLV